MSRAIYWFRNDLRLEDNEGLVKATEDNLEVLPVYVMDSRWLRGKQFGIDRTGPFRMKFLLDSLRDLKTQLQAVGADLYFTIGNPVEVLSDLCKQYNCTKIYGQETTSYYEHTNELELSQSLPCEFLWGETLYHKADLNFTINELPEVFTQFRKAVEKKTIVRKTIEAPLRISSPPEFGTDIPDAGTLGYEVPEVDKRSVIHFEGGSSKATQRLNYYLWEKELLSTYKSTRNGLIGGDYSSKFSPWLAIGAISPRQVYWQVKKYEKYIKKNSSTYWLVFELLWRDYFHFVAKKYGKQIFQRTGILGDEELHRGSDKHFSLWADGRTGEPFVDANMKELNRTGFMSNRGRQIVASYLIHTMKTDWRLGAAYFEKMLIDYDPCSNYGNWMYIAGVGNDPRGGRDFDVDWQKQNYDPQGRYQALWA
ncbi:MAG: DASH family cryptochrome [Roseivirga sp.]